MATANPPHAFSQEEMRDLMAESARIDPTRLERMLEVFTHAGVKRRFSALPLKALGDLRGWPARNACFVESAGILLADTNRDAIAGSGLEPKDIDFLVSVTTTCTDVPDLSAQQVSLLGLRADVRRVPLYGFGCAGGAAGLAHAGLLARAYPGSRVLLQVVELCTTHLNPGTASDTHLVASALFGDGAASVVLSTEGPGLFSIGSGHQEIIPGTRNATAWAPGDDGFNMVLGVEMPEVVGSHIGPIARSFLEKSGRALDDFGTIVAHPGSLKVIEAIERSLAVPKGTLMGSREILANYGNMSSVTVFFILENALQRRSDGPFLMLAVGPGVTAALIDGEIAAA